MLLTMLLQVSKESCQSSNHDDQGERSVDPFEAFNIRSSHSEILFDSVSVT